MQTVWDPKCDLRVEVGSVFNQQTWSGKLLGGSWWAWAIRINNQSDPIYGSGRIIPYVLDIAGS